VTLPYAVLLSQDCDIEQDNPDGEYRNQFLPNYLLLPAFLALQLQEGKHLSAFNLKTERIDSTRWKTLKQNKNDRYHFLDSDGNFQVPELVLDFKAYYTIPRETLRFLYPSCYFATVNELFRESLSQRFANYLARIALPDLSTPTIVSPPA
jgi:hypothetical protein